MKLVPFSQPRDDFESLVYSIWHVAGIKRETTILHQKRSSGEVVAEWLAKGREFAKQKIKVSNRETMGNY